MLPASSLHVLANAFLAGSASEERLSERIRQTLGRNYPWITSLARRYLRETSGRTRPRRYEVISFLRNDRGFLLACAKYRDDLSIARWLIGPPQMQPVTAAVMWDLPILESPVSLAEWLGIAIGDLEWFADLKDLGRRQVSTRLRHYNYRMLSKASGQVRLIEAPKHRLKDIQRQIVFKLLDEIPPHPSVHGFIKRRSIKSFVAPHVDKHVVLRMDLQNFFPSIPRPRIQAFFRTAGYPEQVADLLSGICITTTPSDVWREIPESAHPDARRDVRLLYSRPHLPQGAPTSPSLANVCSYRMDCRLGALAEASGGVYSRYADDLAFSGGEDFSRGASRFATHVAVVAKEEGFAVNYRKTRIMRQGVRQHLAGLVMNQGMNISRAEFDRVKAILTNCVRTGPQAQNREAHPHFRSRLQGRVAFMESINPEKAKRLRALLDQIQW